MATRRTEEGSRPTRPAARAMRSRTPFSRTRSAAESSIRPGALLDERLQRGDVVLSFLRVRAARGKLQVGLVLADGILEVRLADESLTEHEVRVSVIWLDLNRLLE